jgi:hypothetical protein
MPTYNSKAFYTGDGSTTNFSVPFPYLDKAHVTAWTIPAGSATATQAAIATWVSPNIVQLSAAPASGASVEIRRTTPSATPMVSWTTPTVVRAADLNTNTKQLLYIEQEGADAETVNDGRAIRVPVNETAAVLPAAAARASTLLGFDPAGAPATFLFPIGGGVGFAWSTNTANSDPGNGKLKANNATFASVTALYIDNQDRIGVDVTALLDTWDDSNNFGSRGWLRIEAAGDATKYAVFNVTGAVTVASGYRSVVVAPLASSGFPFADGTLLAVSFSPAGERGAGGAGTGDVVGPAGATNARLASFNGSTGKILQDSGVSATAGAITAPGATSTFGSGNTISIGNRTCWNGATFQALWSNQFYLMFDAIPHYCHSAGGGGAFSRYEIDTAASHYWDSGCYGTDKYGIRRDGVSILDISPTSVTFNGVLAFRKRYAGNTQFEVRNSGNDSTGDGTVGNPFKTPIGAYQNIQANYDTCGFQTTINMIGETLVCTNQMAGGLTGGGPVVIQGAGATTVIKPPAGPGGTLGGYAFSAVEGAVYTLRQMKFDSTDAGIDQVVLGHAGSIVIADGITFGDGLYGPGGNNDVSNASGYLVFNNEYTISKSAVATTGNVTAGNNTITNIASMTGIKKYMGVRGTGIVAGAYVNNISGNTVDLAYAFHSPATAPTATGTGVGLAFDYGGQCHYLTGDNGSCYYATNGDPAVDFRITVSGFPMYTSAFIQAYIGGTINAQGLRFVPSVATQNGGGTGNCMPFSVQRRGIIDTNHQGALYFPGSVGNTAVTTITTTAGSKTATIAANNGVFVGNVPSVHRRTTGSWNANDTSFTVASGTGIRVGDKIIGEGLRAGIVVSNISGTTVSMGLGARSGSGGSVAVWFINTQTSSLIAFAPGTFIEAVSGTTLTLSKPAISTITAEPCYFAGNVDSDGVYG